MAGCSNARCSSERRSLRRELDHWRKDLITCVGLESFAEFLMGPERFKEVMPFNGFEAVDCPDWEPSSECRLCHARREVVTESLEHHKELIERQRTLEETPTQDFPGSYVPFKFSSAQEAIRHLASHHASKQQQSSQSALQEDSDNLDSEEDELPPSPQHNSCNGSSARRLRNSPYFLKIPRVPFGHQGRSKHSRQTYSPSDLSRALHDVRAGKLGTRKASNVYGVPRSTIRNYLNRKNCENLTEPKQESEKRTESEGPPLKGGSRLRTLLESVSGKAQAVLEREAVLRRALNSHQESVEDKGRHKQSYANEIKLPITSSILRSLAVARMQEVQSKEKRDHRETQVPKVQKKAVQLKIPRVAQRGRTKVEQNENAETTSQQLKTKLRSTIVSRGGFQMDHHPFESSLFGRNLSKPPAGNSGNSHHDEASSRDGANSPRRKRGRYRCYTPDDLETAVSMVTMGLMSISRAQQLYRIPHSTLEYKVKERRSELKEAAERNRLFYYPAYMHGGSGGSASPYPSPFFQWAWPRSQYYAQDHTSDSHEVKEEDSGGHEEDDCVIVEEFHPSGQASSSIHEAKEKLSHRHTNDAPEVTHPTAEHLCIPATTKKTTSSGSDPQLTQEKLHSVCHSYQHQALGKCPSSDKNVSPNGNTLHQSLMRPNNSSPVPIEVQNLNSNTYNDTRCLDEDFLLWVIYSKGRKGRQLFSFEDLEMNCSDNEVSGSVTDVVSQAMAAVPPTSTAKDTTVHNPPTSTDDKVQETPSQHTPTICQLSCTSNLKKCQNNSSLQDMMSDGPRGDMLRNECNVEAGQVGAKNDPIGNIGKSINDGDMNLYGDKGRVDLYASYLFKPVSLSSYAVSGLLPSDETRNERDDDSDTSSCCSISPPSLSPVTGYDTCSDRDQSQSSVYSLEENEDDGDDPPPPILSPMPTMSWSITFCPALRKEPQSSMSGDVCKALSPTGQENASLGRDSGFKSCSSSKSTEASVDSNENSTNFSCPPEGSSSGVGKVDNVHSDNAPQPIKTLSNELFKDPPTNDHETLPCIDTDVKVAGNPENRKQTFPKKGLATEHGPLHALKVRYLHCLPHRPRTGFAMLQKRKCMEDKNRHVGNGHYLLNRSSTRKASVSDLQLQKARIFPCHVRLRKLSSKQIPHHGVKPQRMSPVFLGRRKGRPRKWMWVKGKSGKLVRVLIPKKESVPSGVGDIEVLRKLRPSAQREVREAQIKTKQVPPSRKDDNSATCTALRPLPVRLAKINDKKFQNTPRKQCNDKDSHQLMQPRTRDKAKPVPGVSYTFPNVKQSQTSVDGDADEVDVKWTMTTVCSCKKVQSTDLPCTCTVTAPLGRSCKVENQVPSRKESADLTSLSAGPKLVRRQKKGNGQMKEKEVMLGIRTLPHRRARAKVLKAFHAVILKKYQKPESFMPAAIRKLRQLPSRNKRLRESTKNVPSLSKTSRKHLLKTLQKTADCEISQKSGPTRKLRIVPHDFSDSDKERTVDDGNKDALIKHTSEPSMESSTDGHHDCSNVEEQMQVEQCSVVLHPMSPPAVKPIIADDSGIQSQLKPKDILSEEHMERRDMPVVKQEHEDPLDDGPMSKSVVEVYEKRQLRVLPERVARLREEERKREAQNTVTFTTTSPSHETLTNSSPFDKDAGTKDVENPPLSIRSAEKPAVLNGKIDSKSYPVSEHNKYLINDGISGRMVHNNAQEETLIQDITCKAEDTDDDERKLRSLPCRMVAQANNAWEVKKVRGKLRKHSLSPSDAEPLAKTQQGRPRKQVLPESLNNAMYTKNHAKYGVETGSELKSGSICVDQATCTKSDDGSSENPSNLVQGSLPNEATFDRELDTANVAASPNREENSNVEIDTTSIKCGFLVKRKVTHCQKTDLRCECMSLNTSLTLQYQDAIISKGWVKTSEKPGRRDTSLIQSLFTQPVTYDTIMKLVGSTSSNSGTFQSQEQVALTQVATAPKGKKGTRIQQNNTKSFKTKKRGFEDVSVTTKDLTEDVPISPSKPITMPISALRAAKQEKTPRTKIHRQADRLRKTLRKFATMTPAKNRIIPYEDVGRRKCKAAKKLFIVPRNPSILWCRTPSSDSKTKGPNARNSPKAGFFSGANSSSKPPSSNTTSNVHPPAKGRTENISNTSSTVLSKTARSSDGLCGERGTLTGSPKNVKKSHSQGKKASKKRSNLPPSTSKGSIPSKVKPKTASNRKHPVTAVDQSDRRDESPSNTAQASRSSARIQKKQLLGFSICPCCALVEAEHFERFKKRVKISKSDEKHQTEKVSSPAKHQLQKKEATGSASQSDNLVSISKPKNKPATKENIQKSEDERNPHNLGSPRGHVNSSSDFPPLTCTSSDVVAEDIPEDLSCHVPQLGRSSSSPPVSSTEGTTLSQWGNLTHGDQILKEEPGAKDQVGSPEGTAVVENGEVFPECDDEWIDEEGFAGPLDLRVPWKKCESH